MDKGFKHSLIINLTSLIKITKLLVSSFIVLISLIRVSSVFADLSSPLSLESYPIQNNLWTVRIDTSGTGNLTITPSSGLTFQSLKCGDSVIDNSKLKIENSTVTLANYSCASQTLATYSLPSSSHPELVSGSSSEIPNQVRNDNYTLTVSFNGEEKTTAISYSDSPTFISINQDPLVAHLGQTINLSAQVIDSYGVDKVTANMGTGLATVPLSLTSGDNKNGIWTATWVVVDAQPILYTTTFTATNTQGKTTTSDPIIWSDPDCATGGNYLGTNLTLPTDCPSGIAGTHTNIGTFTVTTGQTASVYAYDNIHSTYGSVSISATTVDIEGTFDGAGKGYLAGIPIGMGPGGGTYASSGYADGAGYGGWGGYNTITESGDSPPYGSATTPTDLGSGGSSSNTTCNTGNGGGAIKITASGSLTVNGSVSANGIDGRLSGGLCGGGGGSGGSIYLTAGSFTGSGAITANGGNGSWYGGSAGGGAGGRIAIYYPNVNGASLPNTSATGGTATYNGDNGTVLIFDTSIIPNDLYLENSQIWRADPTLEGGSLGTNQTYRNVYIQNSATVTLSGYDPDSTHAHGYGFTFTVTDFNIATGSAIVSRGYSGGPTTGGVGLGPGGGGGASGLSGSGGGGGYGGGGGAGNTSFSVGGNSYGSASSPIDLGSGGGTGQGGVVGGYGGGAIKITASGDIAVWGTLSANGKNGPTGSIYKDSGGGSGGSIYLVADTFTGSGTMTANGGNSARNGGGGGGGRVALYYRTSNGLTTPTATGGISTSSTNGTDGTVIVSHLLIWNGGGGDNNWSTGGNWVGGSAPGSTDAVQFDSTSTKDATIDGSWGGTLATVFINSGYTGTITQGRSLTATGIVQAAGTFTGSNQALTLTGFDQSGGTFNQSSYSPADTLATNLQGYWKMDEGSGTTVTDSSGVGNTASLGGNAAFSTDVPPTAFANSYSVNFDGSGDYLDMGNNLSIAQNKSAVSVGAWIKLGDTSGIQQIFGLSTGTSTANSRVQLYANNDEISCAGRAGDAEGDQTKTTSNANLKPGIWYYVACTIDYANDSIVVYVNGTPKTTGTVAFTATATSNTASQRSAIGIDEDKSGNDFNGQIDEVRFYDRLLTTDEITALASGHNATLDVSTTVSGDFRQSGGTFNASAKGLSIAQNLTITGGTFNPSTGNVIFTGSNPQTLACHSATFNQVSIWKPDSSAVTIGSDCTLPLGSNAIIIGTLTNSGTLSGTNSQNFYVVDASADTMSPGASFSGFSTLSTTGTFAIAGGTIDLSGYTAATFSAVTVSSGSLTPPATGPSTFQNTFTQSGGTFTAGSGALYFNSAYTFSAGTFTASSVGTYYRNNTTISGGTYNQNGGTTYFDTSLNSFTASCGGITFDPADLSVGSSSRSFTASSDCTLNLGNSPTIIAQTFTNNGTVNIGTGTPTFQTLAMNNGSVLTTAGIDMVVNVSLTLNGGTFPQNITTLSVGGNFDNSGNLLPNNMILTLNTNFTGTLNCGNAIFASINLNKTAGSNHEDLTSNCTVSGDLTITQGYLGNPSAARTLYVGGNFTNTPNTTLGGGNQTIELNGAGDQNITFTAGTMASRFRVNKPSGTATLTTDYPGTAQTCEIFNGTLDTNGYEFNCPGGLNVYNNANLKLIGSEAVTTPTLNYGSTVTYKGDGDSQADTYYINPWNYSNLTVDSTDSNDTFSFPSNALTSGLLAYWPMDEASGTTMVADSSGNNNNGTSSSSTNVTTGQIGPYARSFNSSEYIVSTNNINITGSANRTLSFWAKANSTANQGMVGFGYSTNSNWFVANIYNGHWFFNGWSSSYDWDTGVVADTNWHLHTITYNGNQLTWYVDGVSLGTVTRSLNTLAYPLNVGRRAALVYDLPFNGIIDDVRVYNRVLSANEISALANSQTSFLINTVNGNFTIMNGVFIAPSTTLNIAGNFTNNGTFNANNGTVNIINKSYTAPPSDSLVGYWKMDELSGNTATDYSGNNNTLTGYGGTGTPTIVDGKNNKGKYFTKANTQYDLSANNLGITGAAARSVSLWFKPSNTQGLQTIFSLGTNSNSQMFALEYEQIDEGLTFYGYNNDQNGSSNTITRGAWNHAVLIYTGAYVQLYINGNLVPDISVAKTLNTTDSQLYLGKRVDQPTNYYFDGAIDEVRVYNRVLTTAEVSALYNEFKPNIYDQSSNISGTGLNFYNFTSTTPGKTLFFGAGNTASFSGTLTLDHNTINSSDKATQWKVNMPAGSSTAITNTFITNSGCAVDTYDITLTSDTDGGNNDTCWLFPESTSGLNQSSRVGGGTRFYGNVRFQGQ